MACSKAETSIESRSMGSIVKSTVNEEMETENKSVKRVLSEQDMLSEQKSNTNQQQQTSNQRSSQQQQQRNKQRRVKRKKQPRQKKWINNNNNQYNQPPPLPSHSYNNLNHYHPQSLNNLNNFNLSNLTNLNQSNYAPPNLSQPPSNFGNLNAINFQNLNQNSYAPPPPNLNQANFQNLNPLQFQNLNQNLNANTVQQQALSQHKRFHHFGNQYSNQSHGNQHYQQHKPNNSHFNQNNRKLRKDMRKKREQWANRKQAKESLINSSANNNSSNINNQPQQQKQQLCKRQVEAPYNTTQFLMDDHNVREPDCQAFKKLIRKETPKDGLDEIQTNDENSEQPNRRLHTNINDESSDEEFYSSPDDEQDFMEKQFTETYDNAHAERLDLMSKTELIKEYLFLEGKVNVLEDQLRNRNLSMVTNTEQSSTATEEEQSNDNIVNDLETSAIVDPEKVAIVEEDANIEDYTNSNLSQLHHTCTDAMSKNPSQDAARAGKLSLEQLQSEIKRLLKENGNLRRENEFLKRNNYNSNNKSVPESSDEQLPNRMMITDQQQQQLNQIVQIQQQEQKSQAMNEADQSNDESSGSDSSSTDESNDESLDEESSEDGEQRLANGDLNERKTNGHHYDANQVLLIEENTNSPLLNEDGGQEN